MGTRFGAELRERRQSAGLTMRELAKGLEVSLSYVSDVERGSRRPWSEDKVRAAAALVRADPDEFAALAAEGRGGFVLRAVGVSDQHVRVGAELQRAWERLGEDGLSAIGRALVRYGGGR